MRVTLSPVERAIVEFALASANTNREIRVPGGVLHREREIPVSYPDPKEVAGKSHFASVKITAAGSIRDSQGHRQIVAYAENYRAVVREWLGQIAQRGRAAWRDISSELRGALSEQINLSPLFLPQGDRLLHLVNSSKAGLAAYGVALIIDRDRGLTRRLGQCGHCGRFNLTFEGRPRTHCSDQHRLLYDQRMAASRMKMMRERRKREKERMSR